MKKILDIGIALRPADAVIFNRITTTKMETTLFILSKLIVHRKFIMFEFAATGCLLAAATPYEIMHLVQNIYTRKFKHHKFSVHHQLFRDK